MVDTMRLRGKMTEAGFSQRKLSEIIGMNVNSLNYKINNRHQFTIDEALNICDALGIHSSDERSEIFFFKPSQKCNV